MCGKYMHLIYINIEYDITVALLTCMQIEICRNYSNVVIVILKYVANSYYISVN